MSHRTTRIWLGATALLAIGLNASTTMSAEGEKPKANPFAIESDLVRTDIDGMPAGIQVRVPTAFSAAVAAGASDRYGGQVTASVSDSIRKSAEAVRDAKDDEGRKAAQKVLDEQLSKYFDEDMTQRESELAKIEERLTKLRELLERRRTKKQEIIDLQAKVALNEADGLGFYNTEHPSKSLYGGGGGRSGPSTAGAVYVPQLPRTVAPTADDWFDATAAPPKKPAKPGAPAPPTDPAEPTPAKR